MGASHSNDPPIRPARTLDYAVPDPGGMVLLARFATADEAELHAAALVGEGIAVRVLNGNVNALGIPYSGFSEVELHVQPADAARAAEVLAQATSEDLEPAEEGGVEDAPLDSGGQPLPLAAVGAYDTVRLLRKAQTVLASARVTSYLPKLVARGDRPAGQGKRFVLSVGEDDLDRAQRVLEQAEAEGDDEEPRCPRCGSWRLYPVSHVWKTLAALLAMKKAPQAELECLACRHRGPAAEFKAAGSQ